MAAIGKVEVRVRDADRSRLFVYELEALRDDMRVSASPFAARLENIVARFVNGGDDEGEGDVNVGEVVIETVEIEPCPHCGRAD